LKAEDAASVEECDLDEREALVNQLRDQRELLRSALARIDRLLDRLEGKGSRGGGEEEEEASYFPG